jgi:Putative beta-barrel porin-2, OmpL-like. bbp2
MKTILMMAGAALAAPFSLAAQDAAASDTTPRITFGAFVDGYYAYDFGRPASHDRAFTTQAARHDEFAINLAHVEARYASPTVRGRIALQAGTSVQFNYAGEPDELAGSQPNLLPLVQEATLGVAVAPTVWIDGGIMLSHIGSEGWISIDNPTYTRSLAAEFSPYYETGVRATWQPRANLVAQLNVVNGWQLISENNEDKSVGARIDWTPVAPLTLSYSNLVGRDPAASTGEQDVRVFHDFIARWQPSGRALLIGTVDVGSQDGADWLAASLVGRWRMTDTVALNGRVERFDDQDGIVSATGIAGAPGLVTNGASIGIDVARGAALWRTELRTFFGADEAIFPDRDGDDGLAKSSTALVTSLSLRI